MKLVFALLVVAVWVPVIVYGVRLVRKALR